jgi:hypothetical protein
MADDEVGNGLKGEAWRRKKASTKESKVKVVTDDDEDVGDVFEVKSQGTRTKPTTKSAKTGTEDDDEDVGDVLQVKPKSTRTKPTPKSAKTGTDDDEDVGDVLQVKPKSTRTKPANKKKSKPAKTGTDDDDEDEDAIEGAGAKSSARKQVDNREAKEAGDNGKVSKRYCSACETALRGKRWTVMYRSHNDDETFHWGCIKRFPKDLDMTTVLGVLRVSKGEDLPLWGELSPMQQRSAKAQKTKIHNGTNRRGCTSGMAASAGTH